jgi:hypothetical protein
MFKSFKFIDLRNIFWVSISTKPIPNSIADNTKKKKVSETKFKLSNKVPIDSINKYKVIHKSSAVKRRCRAVVTFVLILTKRIKKIIIYKLTSPKCRIFV